MCREQGPGRGWWQCRHPISFPGWMSSPTSQLSPPFLFTAKSDFIKGVRMAQVVEITSRLRVVGTGMRIGVSEGTRGDLMHLQGAGRTQVSLLCPNGDLPSPPPL